MAKIEKIMKTCNQCSGSGEMSDELAAQLPKPPKPGKKLKCPACDGKGFRFTTPKNN